MSEVKIPFKRRFRSPLMDGTKIYTSRTRRMGAVGDTFAAFGEVFELESVTEAQLASVADLWASEGCLSREDFIEAWNEIHPIVRFDPTQLVFLHRFKRKEQAR